MRAPVSRAFAALLVAAAAPLTLAAQSHGGGLREVTKPVAPPPAHRSGFWVAGGMGGGYESFLTDGDPAGWSEEELGFTGNFKLGGSPSPHFRFGGELTGWGKEINGVNEWLGSMMFVAQVYPSADAGFFLKGGTGPTYFHQQVFDGFTYFEVDDNGWGWNAGAGWEFRVARNLFLGPTVDFYEHDYGPFRERLLNIGLTISGP